MYDLARIRYVTEHYRDLQGLTWLPLALWLLTWAGYDLGWVRPTGWLAHGWLLFPTSVAVMMLLMWAIEKMYERVLGWTVVEQEPKLSRRESYGMAAAIMGPFLLKDTLPGVSYIGLVGTSLALHMWLRLGRRGARHYLVLGIHLAVMSLAPLVDANLYPSATVRDVAIKVVAAAGILAVGTIDHLTLVRTLGPVRREEESRA